MNAQEWIDECPNLNASEWAKELYSSKKERMGVGTSNLKFKTNTFSSTPISYTAGQIKKEQIKQQIKEIRENLSAENLI